MTTESPISPGNQAAPVGSSQTTILSYVGDLNNFFLIVAAI